MQYYLRFLCYDDSSHKSGEQIHPDIPIDHDAIDFAFGYGDPVQVGEDETDPMLWPQYVVAHLVLGSEIDDPRQSGKKALLFRVFLARAEEWEHFDVPQVIREIWEEEGRNEEAEEPVSS